MRIAILAVATVALSGCQLYFGGDDEPPPCVYEDIAPGYPSQELRNPETGECEELGGWGGCDNNCGPCPYAGEAKPVDWGACYGACDGLGELACLGTSGCNAAYDLEPNAIGAASFKGCWEVAPSGPIQGGGCWNLDSHECSRHDDCALYYNNGSPGSIVGSVVPKPQFDHCAPEPTALGCSTVDCGPGSHCEETCYPCDGITGPCDPICQPMCVPNEDQCALIDCAPGYECAETCDTMNPNTMGGGCCAQPGQCQAQCVPTTACEGLPDETTCANRSDCTPVYIGTDCTCYPGYCECNVLTYDRCETVGGVMPF